jgi:hypothetical protein
VLGTGYVSPSALALSETHVCFREGVQGAGRILRIPKGGGAVETVAEGVSNLVGIALGGEQLHFGSGNAATLGEGQVLRANLDGSELRPFSPRRVDLLGERRWLGRARAGDMSRASRPAAAGVLVGPGS